MKGAPVSIEADYLNVTIARLEYYKSLADRAVAQIDDAQLRKPLPGDDNSIAIIMKHMAGNMRSRFTDFLASDGEKSWRNRDGEFIDDFNSRDEITDAWETAWRLVFDTLHGLTKDDLARTVTVRGEAHTVIDAIQRQAIHYGYHIGQVVLIARIHLGPDRWKTLTIPRGGSAAYNRSMGYSAEADDEGDVADN